MFSALLWSQKENIWGVGGGWGLQLISNNKPLSVDTVASFHKSLTPADLSVAACLEVKARECVPAVEPRWLKTCYKRRGERRRTIRG